MTLVSALGGADRNYSVESYRYDEVLGPFVPIRTSGPPLDPSPRSPRTYHSPPLSPRPSDNGELRHPVQLV